MGITHTKVSSKTDSGDTTLVRPSDWNAAHAVDSVAPSGLTGATAASRYAGATASGAPASGTFSTGDYIIDQSGKIWVCTTGGSPGTWTQIGGGTVFDGKPFIWNPPASPATEDDEFNDAAGQSGPVNGLAGKWSKHNLVTGVTLTMSDASGPSSLVIDIQNATADQAMYQTAPAGDFTLTCRFSMPYNLSGRQMFGIFMLDTSGNGVGVDLDNGGSGVIRTIDAWVQSATSAGLNPDLSARWTEGLPATISLRKATNNYYGGGWFDERLLKPPHEVTISRTFTIAYVGFGRIFTGGGANEVMVSLDFFRKS